MRPWKRRRAGATGVGLALCMAFAIAACGTSPAPSAIALPGSALPSPLGIATTKDAPLSGGTLGTAQTCDPLASLRPTGHLPPPGHMPAGSTMARIESQKYLIAGVDQTILLDSYRNPLNGQLEGFDIDIVRQIAKAIFGSPDKVEFKAITSAERIPVIQSGAVNIVADSMTITCARWKSVDFSTDYFDTGQRVLVPIDSAARGMADLGGQKVCADSGTTSIQEIAAQPSHPIAVTAPNWTDCLVMLEQGEIAAISTDASVLAGLEVQDPLSKMVGAPFTVEAHGLAISKNAPDFVRFVNAVLEQMRTDGEWTALYKEWFGNRLGPVPAPPVPSYRP